jgi:nondiscriminating glutamyl-tRNA synthetase
MSAVRVRFAPSPTGELHIGGLRTALFNYLFARNQGGRFILRIEDTDRERYVEGTEEGIIEILAWAGIAPDEGPHVGGPHGPYRQSERLHLYREAAERLMEQGNAYRCYCTPEELDEMRRSQQARGLPPKYDGRHRNLSEEERKRYEAEGRKPVIRMRIPDKDERMIVRDAVRGNVAFNSSQLDDQVLIKSDGFPTYHLAVVVDDDAMQITHILRAEEWLPSVPKHLYLYRWLGYEEPVFAHLPLLLNPDRSKMSKRKGDVAAEDFRKKGYLPDALINFLALLGWSPGDDRELMSREELVRDFSLERIGKAAAVFDRGKLDWMNQHYIQQLAQDDLFQLIVKGFVDPEGVAAEGEAKMHGITAAVQPSLVTLADFNERARVFFRTDEEPVVAEVTASFRTADAQRVLHALHSRLQSVETLDQASFKALMRDVQRDTELKGKQLFAPVRAAITLEKEGPDLSEIVEVFGKEKTLARIEQALAA